MLFSNLLCLFQGFSLSLSMAGVWEVLGILCLCECLTVVMIWRKNLSGLKLPWADVLC